MPGWAGWSAGGLVALGGVELEFAEELAGGGVDDPDAEVVDQDEDAGSGVGSADADGVEPAAVPVEPSRFSCRLLVGGVTGWWAGG